MAGTIELFDKVFRQNPYLPKLPWLRDLLRKPYHWIIGHAGKEGLTLNVGRSFPIQVPPKYLAKEMVDYEVEACRAMREWFDTHNGCYFVDIGCSFGFMTAGALFADPACRVVAIDSEAKNLGVLDAMCSLAPGVASRLRVIRALVGEDAPPVKTLSQHVADTRAVLASDPNVTGNPQWTLEHVITLDDLAADVPRVSLDSLLLEELQANRERACLVKCDVEGGEMIVLRGLNRILQDIKPMLMLSVHPPFLPKFGTSADEISRFLGECGYDHRLIAVDHEEHWLCLPR
ncbi:MULTISPECIES: FkbM family methyltransferase [Bradyrhizobium]|uniref:FkbM family methyltransferase n=1 Tax=Bradyrhizobium TaxID=374 RepID=UPI0003FCCD9C|nr:MULTISPECIES: FkbM family methyltransferase [Bradyrhizobium]QOG17795.1 FkbM family methyltransferase [Bradyrhizobium sp. SEMIA]UFW45638.1 FkbM family methyltransferase [Bradyrhizobium arachidis]